MYFRAIMHRKLTILENAWLNLGILILLAILSHLKSCLKIKINILALGQMKAMWCHDEDKERWIRRQNLDQHMDRHLASVSL